MLERKISDLDFEFVSILSEVVVCYVRTYFPGAFLELNLVGLHKINTTEGKGKKQGLK